VTSFFNGLATRHHDGRRDQMRRLRMRREVAFDVRHQREMRRRHTLVDDDEHAMPAAGSARRMASTNARFEANQTSRVKDTGKLKGTEEPWTVELIRVPTMTGRRARRTYQNWTRRRPWTLRPGASTPDPYCR
jgi:hypothetical protein